MPTTRIVPSRWVDVLLALDGLPIKEQAARTGLAYTTITDYRQILRAEGRLAPVGRCSPEDIAEYLQDGLSVNDIARKLKVHPDSIYTRLKKLGIRVDSLRGAPLARVHTGKDVARLMGVSHGSVRIWIARKWLAARRNHGGQEAKSPKKRRWLITEQSLIAFLAVREAWPGWDVADISDPDLRAEAARLRLSAGGHWVKAADLARRLGYHPNYADDWVRLGLLGDARRITYGRTWYVWSADITHFHPSQHPGAWSRQRRRGAAD